MNRREQLRNKRALYHALAQQQLEGLTVPPETVADLERGARGEITTDDVIAKLHKKYNCTQRA